MPGIEILPIDGYTTLERAIAISEAIWDFTDPPGLDVVGDRTQRQFEMVVNPDNNNVCVVFGTWEELIPIHEKANPNPFYHLFPDITPLQRAILVAKLRVRTFVTIQELWPEENPIIYSDEHMSENDWFGSGFVYYSDLSLQELTDAVAEFLSLFYTWDTAKGTWDSTEITFDLEPE